MLQEQLQIRRQFVSDHEAYNAACRHCRSWCDDFAARLELELHHEMADNSRSSVESKLSRLSELLNQCSDEGSGCVQRVGNVAEVVLRSTLASGHSAIDNAVSELRTYWEAVGAKISAARDRTEAALACCNEFDVSLSKLLQQLCDAEAERGRLSVLQSTLAEKMSHAEHSKVCHLIH